MEEEPKIGAQMWSCREGGEPDSARRILLLFILLR